MKAKGHKVVVIGYSLEPPKVEDIIRCMKQDPLAVIILAKDTHTEAARRDYEGYGSGGNDESPHRVRIQRSRNMSPESSETRDAIANMLVGLRHQQRNVAVWIEPWTSDEAT